MEIIDEKINTLLQSYKKLKKKLKKSTYFSFCEFFCDYKLKIKKLKK